MEIKSVMDSRLADLILSHKDDESVLRNINELIDEANKYNTSLCCCDNLWTSPFNEWICDYSDGISADLKKELFHKIKRASRCQLDLYDKQFNAIDSKVFIVGDSEEVYIFWTIDSYYEFKQRILSTSSKNIFYDDMKECFPRIHFDDTVKSSINSLNSNFDDIKKEIVEHLSKINMFNKKFLELSSQGKTNKELSTCFKEFSKINCSPQASRNNTKKLTRSFSKDSDPNEKKKLCCELHTKFTTYNRNKEKQDRIYFHCGDSEIYNGKSIVIHIGTHI